MPTSETDRILALARRKHWLRVRDVREAGMNPETLRRLYQGGRLVRVARGMYTLADLNPKEHHSLAEASLRAPNGVVCLLSALRFHDLTTQAPFEVWMAIEAKGLPSVAFKANPLRYDRKGLIMRASHPTLVRRR